MINSGLIIKNWTSLKNLAQTNTLAYLRVQHDQGQFLVGSGHYQNIRLEINLEWRITLAYPTSVTLMDNILVGF